MDRESFVYKNLGGEAVRLHVFAPENRKKETLLPGIVFFFGGGWIGGTPEQFYPQCEYFASRNMVAISAEYRVHSRHGVSPFECVADGKSAMRWVRSHATDLGIDSKRIAGGGGSAGGHVAACTAIIKGMDEADEDLSISSIPNVLVLFNPVVDLLDINGKGHGAESLSLNEKKKLSPVHNIRRGIPPTIVFHGTADQLVPFRSIERFAREMKRAGNICEVVPFEGKGHGFFNYGRDETNTSYTETLRAADRFLSSLHYLKGEPAL